MTFFQKMLSISKNNYTKIIPNKAKQEEKKT